MNIHSSNFLSYLTSRLIILALLILFLTPGKLSAQAIHEGDAYVPAAPPIIDIWDGPTQTFGTIGLPQRQINILGNVSDSDGIASLTYSLNGGPQKSLSLGPDTRRLLLPGDFNVELFDGELKHGPNQVVITAKDTLDETTNSTVTVNYYRDKVWPLPYETNWETAASINDQAEVIDGKWVYDSQKGGIRPVEIGYDRMVAIGDMAWKDYEVIAEFNIHAVDESGYDPPSNGPAIGLIFHWNGHTDDPVPDWQPKTGWLPLGAIGWYKWQPNHTARLAILGNQGTDLATDLSGRQLLLDTVYYFKMRVESTVGGPVYRLKVWQINETEPAGWDLSGVGALDDPTHGSLVFFAHHVDATFGNFTVTKLGDAPAPSTIQSDDFNEPSLKTGIWTFVNPLGDGAYSITGVNTPDAWLNISVPAGSDHDLLVGENRAPRVMQSVNDTDFDVEAKFETGLFRRYEMQGIVIHEDDNNYLRIEFLSDGIGTRIYAANLSSQKVVYTDVEIGLRSIAPLYMRVSRTGNRWILFYSLDGSDWIPYSTFPLHMAVSTIGVYSANATGSTSPASTGQIDYFFNRASPLNPEDSSGALYLPFILRQ